MFNDIVQHFAERAPRCEYWSLRLEDAEVESVQARRGVADPVHQTSDIGAMVTVVDGQGIGYGATSDLSERGLLNAFDQARKWAHMSASRSILTTQQVPQTNTRATYTTPVLEPWSSLTLGEKLELVTHANAQVSECAERAHANDKLADWHAGLTYHRRNTRFVTSAGGDISQTISSIDPTLSVTLNEGPNTQRRSHGNGDLARQGGLELLGTIGFASEAQRLVEQGLELLSAPECPEGKTDLLLMPSQMVLQIHESIGHPLELDRILGDERNYAGGSFVTLDMLGTYQYGSEHLNVTFDPSRASQLASYGFDDEGSEATREYLIRDGVLCRALGGASSQARANTPGVANARANGWNRPPIDRMANINIEPGEHSLDGLVSSIENGILMETNRSWSIDHMRNKFQFGCEYARLITNGELQEVVKNPNYRGRSADFWRSLDAVGNPQTVSVMGTMYCGKGEPNQVIHVGHASPACVFRGVDVFGGG